MLQVLIAISQKFYYRKEAWGYAKVIHEKSGQVFEILKTVGTQMPAWKEKKEKDE